MAFDFDISAIFSDSASAPDGGYFEYVL